MRKCLGSAQAGVPAPTRVGQSEHPVFNAIKGLLDITAGAKEGWFEDIRLGGQVKVGYELSSAGCAAEPVGGDSTDGSAAVDWFLKGRR